MQRSMAFPSQKQNHTFALTIHRGAWEKPPSIFLPNIPAASKYHADFFTMFPPATSYKDLRQFSKNNNK